MDAMTVTALASTGSPDAGFGRRTRGLVDRRIIGQEHFIDMIVGQFAVRDRKSVV